MAQPGGITGSGYAVPSSEGATSSIRTPFRALRAFLLKRARPDEVDDLMQDVALRLHARASGGEVANAEAYLFQVARSVLADRGRRDQVRERRHHQSIEEFHHPVEEISPERVLAAKERLGRVMEALRDIPDRSRQAFVLHRFEEMSYAEIARHMGVSVSAVEKHITRAMRSLAARLED